MAENEGRFLATCILGFGGGIYIFFKGLRQFRKYRVVADTPAIRIRSVPMGLVQIRGEARGQETLLSPLTRTPCYLFKVVVEEWHSDSEGGGEWKHVATDVQNVKFDLQDDSGNVLIDPTNAELDLPCSLIRKVRSHSAVIAVGAGPRGDGATASGSPSTDTELLQYVSQARVRHAGQLVARGANLLMRAGDSEHAPQRQGFLSMLSNPTGAGAAAFQGQMMRAMMARRDPTGETTRLALEVWKHPQGTPEFESALVRFGQAYAQTMALTQGTPDAATVLGYIHQQPQTLAMVAMLAGSAEPQSDPEAEQARQTALGYGRGQIKNMLQKTQAATGDYRLTEFCLVPGKTYAITGTCAENPSPRDPMDRNIIVKGTNEPTFLISSRMPKDVEAWLRKQSLWMVLGGAAATVIFLAIILGKMGLL